MFTGLQLGRHTSGVASMAMLDSVGLVVVLREEVLSFNCFLF